MRPVLIQSKGKRPMKYFCQRFLLTFISTNQMQALNKILLYQSQNRNRDTVFETELQNDFSAEK